MTLPMTKILNNVWRQSSTKRSPWTTSNSVFVRPTMNKCYTTSTNSSSSTILSRSLTRRRFFSLGSSSSSSLRTYSGSSLSSSSLLSTATMPSSSSSLLPMIPSSKNNLNNDMIVDIDRSLPLSSSLLSSSSSSMALQQQLLLIPTMNVQSVRPFSTTTTTTSKDGDGTATNNTSSTATMMKDNDDENTNVNSTNNNDKEGDNNKPTFRSMIRKYGPIFVSTYFGVYFATWGSLFAGIESCLLDPAYIMSFVTSTAEAEATTTTTTAELILDVLQKYPWTQPAVPFVERYPFMANLAVAWIATKPTEPIRFGVTVMILPRVARFVGYNDNNDKTNDDTDDAGSTKTNETEK